MRENTKRLTVISGANNSERIKKTAIGYINKMHKRGWYPIFYTEGNSFLNYECYVHTAKPKNAEEIKQAIKKSIEQGWQFKNKVCVGKEWGNGYYK